MTARFELGQAAYSAGLARLDDLAPDLIRWAASRYQEPPPWWPALAPMGQEEREQVWSQLALKAAQKVQEQAV